MKVRHANQNDINQIVLIYQSGSRYLASQHINQWTNGYPGIKDIENDLKNHNLYVLENDGLILGACAIISGIENTYIKIDGKWLNDDPYLTIHRIGIKEDQKGKGYANYLLEHAIEIAKNSDVHNIRIDTHPQNLSMQRFVTKHEFVYTGNICLVSGDLRYAYQRII